MSEKILLKNIHLFGMISLFEFKPHSACMFKPFFADAAAVVGVAGFSAELQCNLEPKIKNDELLLVLWYKLGTASPVYT